MRKAPHDRATSNPAFHQAFLAQPPICCLDGASIDPERRRKLARCREPTVLGKNSARNSTFDCATDLLGERHTYDAIHRYPV
jgi:hypothetical protein